MANLLQSLARKERDRFFARLDLEWGRGIQFRTHPDRSPNVHNVTAPRNDIGKWAVSMHGETLWMTEWRELAEAYAATLREETDNRVQVRARVQVPLSQNQSANIAALVATFRAGCQNQTVVKRRADPVEPKVYRSPRLMPQYEPALRADFSGFETLVPAPYRIMPDGRKVWLP